MNPLGNPPGFIIQSRRLAGQIGLRRLAIAVDRLVRKTMPKAIAEGAITSLTPQGEQSGSLARPLPAFTANALRTTRSTVEGDMRRIAPCRQASRVQSWRKPDRQSRCDLNDY
jgi:hypothetical protein